MTPPGFSGKPGSESTPIPRLPPNPSKGDIGDFLGRQPTPTICAKMLRAWVVANEERVHFVTGRDR